MVYCLHALRVLAFKKPKKRQGAATRCAGRVVRVPTDFSPDAVKYAFAVMVKAPRSGEVKTRLVPPLHAEEASLLSVCFIKDILGNLLELSQSAPVDCYAA